MTVCSQCGRQNAEGAKFCNECAAPLAEASPSREQRKTITVLFCDVTGSTELGEKLDPETLRALLARYFERMKQIVERHGGTVEKFIGDAVMAVFGVPVLHEDDALRALRAAVEMRESFPELGVHGRIGVTTGEVVTGTEERLATGEAVNVAARLEQAAQPGEILIAEETLGLTRDAAQVEKLEPLTLKGKAKRVNAYRLLSVRSDAPAIERHLEAPMVGRTTELRRLHDAFEQALRNRSCQLFTVLGAAGVGKSRLAAEFLASVEGATVARGRCLPYGEGITYWPVVEVLKQLGVRPEDEKAAAGVAALLGETDAPTTPDEIAWATRKTLEQSAAEQPLVCVFDDVHWGEEMFLELIEHVADLSRQAPILLLCMARPELLDRRSGWGGGKLNATTVLLEPLADEETERLIESLAHVGEDLRGRIREASEGNPLFVEEMVAMLRESPDGEVVVPPTIQALLAARLDQLEASERAVLERGAVEGRVFHRGAVQALAPEEQQVTAQLAKLVRKELVRPERPQIAGDDAYRFRHLLIRDAAYDSLPKATRAELHARFADWLEVHGRDLTELDEILGYHWEQACRYRQELGRVDDQWLRAAGKAGQRLAVAGARALGRGDMHAAANLLERAAPLLEGESSRPRLLLDLGVALRQTGQLPRADAILREGIALAEAAGERQLELRGRVEHLFLQIFTDPEGRTSEARAETERIIPELEMLEDDVGLSRAWRLVSMTHLMACRYGAMIDPLERALVHARRAGDRGEESETVFWLGCASALGPAPVPEAIRRCETLLEEAGEMRIAQASLRANLALLAAMAGEFVEARQQLAEGRAIAAELGLRLVLGGLSMWEAMLELLADDPAAAERAVRDGYDALERMGDQSYRSTAAAYVASAVWAQGRSEEADRFTQISEQAAASDDVYSQVLLRAVRAKVLAHRGDLARAETLARDAVALAAEGDALHLHGDALVDLSEVLVLAGQRDEAAVALEQALALYERKGNVVMAGRARERLDEVRAPSAATRGSD
jgi:class 3 adenylate cyclase/tetratricopeptide (TPR) repeat protein